MPQVALSARLREGQLTVVDDLKSGSFSTAEMVKTIKVCVVCLNTTDQDRSRCVLPTCHCYIHKAFSRWLEHGFSCPFPSA